MALLGIPSYFAVEASCTMDIPLAAWMARRPMDPSVPVPERMTQTAFSPRSSARDRKKKSMGIRMPRKVLSGTVSWRARWKMAMSLFGGMT